MKDRNHGGVEFSGLSLVAVSYFGEKFSVPRCARKASRICPRDPLAHSEARWPKISRKGSS